MAIRNRLESLMQETLRDQERFGNWRYWDFRPRPVPSDYKTGMKVIGDCSKGVQFLCKWGGAPDPMGLNYGPYGNSQTLCFHLEHAPYASDLEIGDVVTFGWNGNEHAAMVLEPGLDPLLWSFGHQGAPNTVRLSTDHRYHQYRKLPIGPFVVSPQQVLRDKTGWFSWVAWRLGEGDWAAYDPKDPKVRPSVPNPPPVKWWVELAKFLANRSKGNKQSTTPHL